MPKRCRVQLTTCPLRPEANSMQRQETGYHNSRKHICGTAYSSPSSPNREPGPSWNWSCDDLSSL
ncbi:hypothetical protein K402DRAFT_180720 [Aulographum hederae CBS 113979]|uniref:Uncharacterized protein n=1 Tax=Aulographum hederae CBS 113979 TaxID=1176131 RepID=A0A6G1GPZ7_9PEZI|nr:hypothetical protein K402DRAFT_180720 [Aulographum hederae CBS 113979]